MASLKNLLSQRRFHQLLNPKTLTSLHYNFPLRPISTSPQTQPSNSQTEQTKKPLSTFFSRCTDQPHSLVPFCISMASPKTLNPSMKQIREQLRILTKETTKRVPILTKEKKQKRRGEPFVVKELSIDMVVFLKFLYENGYFKDANFGNVHERFDLGWFDNSYAFGYAKFAAQKFATDNLEIAKGLSGSAVKQVVVFGCPSTGKSSVYPAKCLRKFFEVPENTVCSKCMLRDSCKYVNQNVWKGDSKTLAMELVKTLDMELVMKVVISYAVHLVHPQLVMSDEVSKSVNHLLNEFVKLSKIT